MPTGAKNKLLPGCGFHHISIQTENIDESIRFYRDALGMTISLEFNAGGRRFALLDMGDGSYIELQVKPASAPSATPASGGALVHFALAVRDTRAAIEMARMAGYPVTTEPKEVMLNHLPATVAFFTGPSGESVELFQEH
jgi:catechol 2,3-dioxygenase-like lactoylglutathione lyase family enzyme